MQVPTITIRDVPDDVAENIRKTAGRDGISMQQLLRGDLVRRFGARPDPVALLDALIGQDDPYDASVWAVLQEELAGPGAEMGDG